MSNMPVVKRRLHEWFGPERVQIPDGTATLIAEGAAWIASDRAALQLAKNVELQLARQSYLPLVKAGTAMPREGEVQQQSFHLYCTDPRDGMAKFQICAPKRSGSSVLPNEPRVHLENISVNVDRKAKPFRERLELDIRITDDLILEGQARSLNVLDEDRKEVHNLEFGLAFPTNSHGDEPAEESEPKQRERIELASEGALSVRANVADREDLRLVPGEHLYELNPRYFDSRGNPPEEQVLERLYYEPCVGCGRASNDPLCKCSDILRA
jgi:molecular chaperone DnaK